MVDEILWWVVRVLAFAGIAFFGVWAVVVLVQGLRRRRQRLAAPGGEAGLTDEGLADVLIERLNVVVEDPAVRADVVRLLEARVEVGGATAGHPTIQVHVDADGARAHLGFLGMLNGVVGVHPAGPRKNWGYISAVLDDEGKLLRFERT